MNKIDHNKIENKLHEIKDYLLGKKIKKDINLMDGLTGEVLFLAYYSKHFKDEQVYESIVPRLEKIFHQINISQHQPSFATGISGVIWTIEHLCINDFIDFDMISLYESTDEYLYKSMISFIKDNNYDYLHGALGIANYFSNRNNVKTISYLNEFIDLLSEKIVMNSESVNSFGIISHVRSKGKNIGVYNFSLSHGMTSVLYFLDKCLSISEFENNYKIKYLIDGILAFYDQNKNDISIYDSFYPSWIGKTEQIYNSRIGWCYGDLSIALILLKFKSYYLKKKYKNHAIELIDNTLKRLNPEKENIFDAAICHGSSGLSLLYDDAYLLTNDTRYLTASEYWLNHCLDEKQSEGICSFKTYFGTELKWSNREGLLEGISGIGLVLLSKLNIKNVQWKECLML